MSESTARDDAILELKAEGLSQKEIAAKLGLSPGAICKRLKRLRRAGSVNDLSLGTASKLVEWYREKIAESEKDQARLDAQIEYVVNFLKGGLSQSEGGGGERECEVIDVGRPPGRPENGSAVPFGRQLSLWGRDLMEKEMLSGANRGVLARLISEKRQCMEHQCEMLKDLYSLEEVERFIHEVMSAIESVSPDVRARIVEKIKLDSSRFVQDAHSAN